MSKTKKVIEFISLEPYSSGYFCFIQNYTYKQCLKKFKKFPDNNPIKWYEVLKSSPDVFMGNANASCSKRSVRKKKNDNDTNFFFIISYKGIDVNSPDDMIDLAHEVLHLCQFYLVDFLNRDVETEAEAYFHTYCMSKIVEAIQKT